MVNTIFMDGVAWNGLPYGHRIIYNHSLTFEYENTLEKWLSIRAPSTDLQNFFVEEKPNGNFFLEKLNPEHSITTLQNS